MANILILDRQFCTSEIDTKFHKDAVCAIVVVHLKFRDKR